MKHVLGTALALLIGMINHATKGKDMKEKFNQYREGLITQAELFLLLEMNQIHGAIDNENRFCGYDYKNQE